jgi:hypothetical protein
MYTVQNGVAESESEPGAARSRIILVDPEPYRDAAPAPTSPSSTYVEILFKIRLNNTVYYNSPSNVQYFKSYSIESEETLYT